MNLREVVLDDCEFILSLRCSEKVRFLSPTNNDVALQREYIKNYLKKQNEWYLIIEDKRAKPLARLESIM